MLIVETTKPSQIRLSEDFLSPYRVKGDPFKSLLARSTYLTKYCRGNIETWTDTIRRVVEGNLNLAPGVQQNEAELLFHLFWTGQALPPGRGLWTGGVEGIPADARYNCWATTLYEPEDWCWVANQLMLGGGVGVGLGSIDQLPGVVDNNARFAIWCGQSHPNFDEVKPEGPEFLNGSTPTYNCADSREGWIEALRRVLRAAYEGTDLVVDVTAVRPRGEPIKTFGGIACGPGPLAHLLRSTWNIIRGACGRQINSIEALDITNHIGLCIKSGNVRRSALIVLGSATDQAFRDAKKDEAAVVSHRHTSNNTIVFRSESEIATFDWRSLINDNIEFGEPGILNMPLIHKTDPGVTGINPCFTGDTRLATQYGMIPFKELASKRDRLRVTTDTRVVKDYGVDLEESGVEFRDATPAFKTSDSAEVFRVKTKKGYTLKVTGNHKIATPDGLVPLKDLQLGDNILLQSGEGQWGKEGEFDLGLVVGLIEGDGHFCEDRATVRFWGAQKDRAEALLPVCKRFADAVPSKNGRQYTLNIQSSERHDSVSITSERLATYLAEYGYTEKGRVPEVVWRGSRDCVRGYLLGLFAADDSVQWNASKQSFSIRLAQSNELLLEEVQTLLANFGIVSSIYKRREAGYRRLPDSNRNLKDYWCKAQYELVISKTNAVTFKSEIGFFLEKDQAVFEAWKASWKRGPYQEDYLDELVSVESIGFETTYCTTQPSNHTLISGGIVVGNCGEIPLHDREACNLAEVFPAKFESGINPHMAFRLVTRYSLRQRLTPLSDPKSDAIRVKNMRVGVGLGGICDFAWTPETLTDWYGVCRKEADRYADELGVNRPNAVTTTKPSGTISLLNDSSPGNHAPHAPFYIRRIRIAKNDPMAESMIAAGVPHEQDVYDNTGHTWAFSFPTKASHNRTSKVTETVREQFQRQADIQNYWSDNAVSMTLNFDPDKDLDELEECLKEFVPQLKSTSCLPSRHGYSQAPYEEIDQATYSEMHAKIDHASPLVNAGDVDSIQTDECEGGVCPIR